MIYISQNDLNNCIKNNLYKLPDDIDLVIANPRSGYNPAIIISLLKNLPICDISVFKTGNIYESGITKKHDFINNLDEARKILIVEDSSYSGNSIRLIKEKIPNKYKDKCILLTIYVNDNTKDLTDIYFENINKSRIFEWNLFHHSYLKYAALELNVIYDKDKLIIKPTSLVNSIIIDDNLNKKDIESLLKDINYNKIIYRKELTDEAFIICKDKSKYDKDILIIEY